MVKTYNEIRDKLGERGWEIFDFNKLFHGRYDSPEKVEIGPWHAILPYNNKSRDPSHKFNIIDWLTKKFDSKIQSIEINSRNVPIVGFQILNNEKVRLLNPESNVIDYNEFLESLDTLVSLKMDFQLK